MKFNTDIIQDTDCYEKYILICKGSWCRRLLTFFVEILSIYRNAIFWCFLLDLKQYQSWQANFIYWKTLLIYNENYFSFIRMVSQTLSISVAPSLWVAIPLVVEWAFKRGHLRLLEIIDSYIMIHTSSKITVMKKQWK